MHIHLDNNNIPTKKKNKKKNQTILTSLSCFFFVYVFERILDGHVNFLIVSHGCG